MKYLIKYLNILVIVFLFLSCYNDYYLPSIVNYKTDSLNIKISKPFFYRINKSLFFSNSNFNSLSKKAIYTLDNTPDYNKHNIFVSPNSEYLLIQENDQLILINHHGQLIDNVAKTKRKLYFEFEKNKYRWKNIQWSKDSRFILLIKDLKKRKGEIINLIAVYDIKNKKIVPIIETPVIIDSYFSYDSKSIYYSYFETPNLRVYRQVKLSKPNNINELTKFPNGSIYVTLLKDDMLNRSYDISLRIIDKWDLNSRERDSLIDGIYIHSYDTIKLVMKSSLSGKNFKGIRHSNHGKHKSYFLPGNKFYMFKNHSKEYDGYLLIDTESMKYEEMGKNVEFYFNISSSEVETYNGKLKCTQMRSSSLEYKVVKY